MYYNGNEKGVRETLRRLPNAVAVLQGGPLNSSVNGTVKLYQETGGVLVVADITGLPFSKRKCQNGVFAFHIHAGTACTGNEEDPFADAGTHYDPNNCPHPDHAGDMPPLFSASGRAFLAFLTDRFTVNEVIGRAVIIHDSPDDFRTQPSGNAGRKIACGVISSVER